jgi:hypothetical protein
MSDPTLPGTPGTGPVPEPEAEGFREEQIEAEKARQQAADEETAQRSAEQKAFYSGEAVTPKASTHASYTSKSAPKSKGSHSS